MVIHGVCRLEPKRTSVSGLVVLRKVEESGIVLSTFGNPFSPRTCSRSNRQQQPYRRFSNTICFPCRLEAAFRSWDFLEEAAGYPVERKKRHTRAQAVQQVGGRTATPTEPPHGFRVSLLGTGEASVFLRVSVFFVFSVRVTQPRNSSLSATVRHTVMSRVSLWNSRAR
ncbi:UNVERIFIED_CONTAM: hypothetical protein HHA_452600 [Hammondia hammondi]|eukprot:XP_008885741.1 hypothetical protein HHA_452600 [Hammondia hammondi]